MTQQNAALVEQAAAAAASLHEQTRQLKAAVSVFRIADAVFERDERAPREASFRTGQLAAG